MLRRGCLWRVGVFMGVVAVGGVETSGLRRGLQCISTIDLEHVLQVVVDCPAHHARRRGGARCMRNRNQKTSSLFRGEPNIELV